MLDQLELVVPLTDPGNRNSEGDVVGGRFGGLAGDDMNLPVLFLGQLLDKFLRSGVSCAGLASWRPFTRQSLCGGISFPRKRRPFFGRGRSNHDRLF